MLGDGARRWNWCRVDVSLERGALVEETRDGPNRKLTGASLPFFFFFLVAVMASPALSSLGGKQHAKRGDSSKGKAKASSAKGSGNCKVVPEAVTLEQFISQMQPLIDLEKVIFLT